MLAERMSRGITFKEIVSDGDNWQRYQVAYQEQVTPHQVAEVEKMLHFGDPVFGFATYICLNCGETRRVTFSCKSRICSSCDKVHADEWSRQLVGRLFNITRRHITFTVAGKHWSLLEVHPVWRKVLFCGLAPGGTNGTRDRHGDASLWQRLEGQLPSVCAGDRRGIG